MNKKLSVCAVAWMLALSQATAFGEDSGAEYAAWYMANQPKSPVQKAYEKSNVEMEKLFDQIRDTSNQNKAWNDKYSPVIGQLTTMLNGLYQINEEQRFQKPLPRDAARAFSARNEAIQEALKALIKFQKEGKLKNLDEVADQMDVVFKSFAGRHEESELTKSMAKQVNDLIAQAKKFVGPPSPFDNRFALPLGPSELNGKKVSMSDRIDAGRKEAKNTNYFKPTKSQETLGQLEKAKTLRKQAAKVEGQTPLPKNLRADCETKSNELDALKAELQAQKDAIKNSRDNFNSNVSGIIDDSKKKEQSLKVARNDRKANADKALDKENARIAHFPQDKLDLQNAIDAKTKEIAKVVSDNINVSVKLPQEPQTDGSYEDRPFQIRSEDGSLQPQDKESVEKHAKALMVKNVIEMHSFHPGLMSNVHGGFASSDLSFFFDGVDKYFKDLRHSTDSKFVSGKIELKPAIGKKPQELQKPMDELYKLSLERNMLVSRLEAKENELAKSTELKNDAKKLHDEEFAKSESDYKQASIQRMVSGLKGINSRASVSLPATAKAMAQVEILEPKVSKKQQEFKIACDNYELRSSTDKMVINSLPVHSEHDAAAAAHYSQKAIDNYSQIIKSAGKRPLEEP